MPLLNYEISNQLVFPNRRKVALQKATMVVSDSAMYTPRQLIEAWATIGGCHKFDKDPDLSEKAYLKAVKIIQRLDDNQLLGEAYEDLGDALFFCQEFSRASAYYQQAIKSFENLGVERRLLLILSQLAYSSKQLEQREEERNYLRAALPYSRPPSEVEAGLLERIAWSLAESGNYQEAIKTYESALAIFESVNYKRYWQQSIEKLAEFYKIVGDEESARLTINRL